MSQSFQFQFYLDPNPPETFKFLVRPFLELVKKKAGIYGKEVLVTVSTTATSYEYVVNIEYQDASIRGEAKAFVDSVIADAKLTNSKYVKKVK